MATKTQKIKKIGILSFAIIGSALMAVFGIFIGLLYAGLSSGIFAFGLLYTIIVPFVYAILGFVGGALTAIVYNLAAKWVGGIEVELAD